MSKEDKKSTDLIARESTELFTVNDDEALKIMALDAESYVDETSADDIAMPRITLLQSASKPLKKSEADYVKGAEEGDIYNTLTKEVIAGDVGILFVPVKRRIVYLHWKDIDAGGGLIENFGDDPTEYLKVEPNEMGKRRTSIDTEIVKTHETFGYFIQPSIGKFSEVLISLASTNEKKQKRFNALIRSLTSKDGKTLPEYAGVYRITTVPESNDKGSWFTFEFSSMGLTLGIPNIGKSVYEAAKKFAELVKKGEVDKTVKYDQEVCEGIDEETEISDAPM